MLSIADVLKKKQFSSKPKIVKEQWVNYESSSLKTKARVYAVIYTFLSNRLEGHTFKFFVKQPKAKVIVQIISSNNSLVASLNLSKTELSDSVRTLLMSEELIKESDDIIIQPKIG